MQITINIEVLKSVQAMTEDEARHTIEQTERVRINEGPLTGVKKPENQKITVEAPTNLGDGPLIIDLIDKHGGITTLAYDLKEKKFLQQEGDEE